MEMKKIWKRLGAVLLTAALALGLTAGAWAVDEDSDTGDCNSQWAC